MDQKKSILVVTPALSGGGWISLEDPINNSVDQFDFTVVGLGPIRQKARKFILYRLPYFDYANACEILASISPLNFLYNFPLIIMASFLILAKRPKLVIGNGFFSAYAVALLSRLVGARVIVSYHGCFEFYLGSSSRKIVKALSKFVDKVFVNSEGSNKDVVDVIGLTNAKVITVNHWAHEVFFCNRVDRLSLRVSHRLADNFVILYVGDISKEKLVPMLLNTIDKLKHENDFNDFVFIFAGTGDLDGLVQRDAKHFKNVRYLGYVGSRKKLSELYSVADVVWSFADTSYLARPAVEALASGTPIIIPDVSAVTNKALNNVKIGKDLFPSEVGWLIDGSDINEAATLLVRIKREKLISPAMRDSCRKYAEIKYSMKNIDVFVEALK